MSPLPSKSEVANDVRPWGDLHLCDHALMCGLELSNHLTTQKFSHRAKTLKVLTV